MAVYVSPPGETGMVAKISEVKQAGSLVAQSPDAMQSPGLKVLLKWIQR